MNYYAFHIGDYASATRHLSWTEDAAYRRLLDAYYVREVPLPVALPAVFRLVVAMSAAERKAVETVLREFFQETPEGWRHGRCDTEIEAAAEKKYKASQSAKLRWDHAMAMRSHSDGISEGNAPNPNPNPNPSKEQELKDSSATADVCSPANGKQSMPNCPVDELIGLYHEKLPTLPRVRVRNAKRNSLLSGRWRQVFADGKAHDKAEGLALFSQFFAFVADSNFLTGKAKPDKDRTPFLADLEWLMSPTNFAKTVEGRYHR